MRTRLLASWQGVAPVAPSWAVSGLRSPRTVESEVLNSGEVRASKLRLNSYIDE